MISPENRASGQDLLRTGFEARTRDTDGTLVIRLRGELDLATAPRLARDLNQALDANPPSVALDLSELTFLDSIGIRVLVTTAQRAEAQGSQFLLRSPSPAALKPLRLTGLDKVLAIEPAPGQRDD